jgi:NDP-sugar pyrophosphorylase family protein
VRALILAAGLGTRLRPLTALRAKAAFPVNGEVLIRRIVRSLVNQGIADLIVNLHHLPATVTRVLGDGSDLGARIRYSWENPVLGSAGGPRRALPLLVDEDENPRARFVLVNGDTLTDADLGELIRAHESAGDARVTMALIPNPEPEKYGGVIVEAGRVVGFTRRGETKRNYHFIGLQVVERGVFAGLPDGEPAESVSQVYRGLIAADPKAIAAYISRASFHDIGTPADYLNTSLAVAASEGNRLVGTNGVTVESETLLTDTAVWDDVVIGRGARLERTVVCDGARIRAGSQYSGCVLLPAAGRLPGPGERIEDGLLIAPLAPAAAPREHTKDLTED